MACRWPENGNESATADLTCCAVAQMLLGQRYQTTLTDNYAPCRVDRQGGNPKSHYKVEPEIVAELYRRWVMPLNKEVQIQYLLRRLEAP